MTEELFAGNKRRSGLPSQPWSDTYSTGQSFILKKKKKNMNICFCIQVKRDALIGEAEARKESTIGDLSFNFTFKNV